ncbi:hypothetical protein EPN28_04995 [Patescibacteria group bacterium]|nr:MAG: hypothetical protein EPN28_04995 [Patescibacteria group bacterium]
MEIIDGNDREIDVEKIMATVREHLERQRAQRPSEAEGHEVRPIEPPESPPGQALIESLGHYLTMLNRLRDPKPQGVIAAGGSALKERVKRWLRRILAPYHRAIFVRQEAFNTSLVELLNRLLPALEEHASRHRQALEEHMNRHRQALEEHEARHNYAAGLLKLRLDELAKRNTDLDNQLANLLYLRDRLTEAWDRIESLRVEYDHAIAQIYSQLEDQVLAGAEQTKRKTEVE